LLTQIGLGELIAATPDEYVRVAVALAGDRPRRAAYRAELRARLEASPLFNARRQAKAIEAAATDLLASL
ncbi:MAG: hypothetical protein WD715_08115, partial [Dongiaceae bacterium]